MGRVGCYSDMYNNVVCKEYLFKKIRIYYPAYFSPNLRMFPLAFSLPETIAKKLDSSFNSFWSDTDSAGNAIRNALESLMDFLQCPEGILHNRIDRCLVFDSRMREMLLAIKWIGNSGSHGANLTKLDLLDAYSIMEHCLQTLFPDGRKEVLYQIASKINQNRLPRSVIGA